MAEHGELIVRGDLLENLKLLRRTRAATATPEAMSMMLRGLIRDAPAVDAVPVVHGRWIKMTGMMPPEYHGHYECSECGWHMKGLRNSWTREEEMTYCPNCGAKMDGERRDEGGQR